LNPKPANRKTPKENQNTTEPNMNRNNASNSHRNHPSPTRHCAAYARAFQRLDAALEKNTRHDNYRKLKLLDLMLFGADEVETKPSTVVITPNEDLQKNPGKSG
jgi:hypothetical protein